MAQTVKTEDLEFALELINDLNNAFSAKIVGQERLLESLVIALLSNGHVLMESVPGLAKTTAARTVADAISAKFQRIQCTPDLLPSDIIGTQIYDQVNSKFTTILGPVHANILLLDEVNRASAKTQSALLEAMEEKQTSIAGEVYHLPDPFIVLATQNPVDQEGTYPLPEAQMDRFMIKETLQYPTAKQEAEVLHRIERGVFASENSAPVASIDQIKVLQKIASRIYIAPAVIEYITNLVYATRNPEVVLPENRARLLTLGASPRGTISLMKAARVHALIRGSGHVIPDDVVEISSRVLGHRLTLSYEAKAQGITAKKLLKEIINKVPLP